MLKVRYAVYIAISGLNIISSHSGIIFETYYAFIITCSNRSDLFVSYFYYTLRDIIIITIIIIENEIVQHVSISLLSVFH